MICRQRRHPSRHTALQVSRDVACHATSRIFNESGQSTIEYLVVCFILIAVLVKGPGVYQRMSGTMQNKYHSYAFSVAISDPPSKTFDDALHQDAAKIEHVLEVLEEIEKDIESAHLPDPGGVDMPGGVEKIWRKITHLL